MQNIEHTYTNPPNDSTHTSLHHHHHYHHPLHLFSITQHPNKPLKQQSHSKYEGSNIKAMPNTMHNTKDNIFLHPCFFLLPSSSFPLNHPPPRPVVERIGIVGSNGFMSDSLKFGDFDDELVDKLIGNVAVKECEKKEFGVGVGVEKYEICDVEMVDVIPNLDCNLSDKEMKFERHCPEKGKMLNCLVPIPVGYRNPIPWPQSRDEVFLFSEVSLLLGLFWFFNVRRLYRILEDCVLSYVV